MKFGAEKILLLAFAALLLPMTIMGGMLAKRAFEEGDSLRNAPVLPKDGRENERFYRHTGLVGIEGSLAPQEYPEIRDALTYRVSVERRIDANQPWSLDESAEATKAHTNGFSIGGVAVEFTSMTSLATPVTTAFREESMTKRLKIEFQSARDLTASVFGVYRNGKMTEGRYERLLVVSPDEEAKTLERIDSAGRTKGMVLAVITTLVAGLLVATLKSVLIRKPSSPQLVRR